VIEDRNMKGQFDSITSRDSIGGKGQNPFMNKAFGKKSNSVAVDDLRNKTSHSDISVIDKNWLSQMSNKRTSDVIHMNNRDISSLIENHKQKQKSRFDPNQSLFSTAMPSIKDASQPELNITSRNGPFRAGSLQHSRNTAMHSTFFVPHARADFGPMEKP